MPNIDSVAVHGLGNMGLPLARRIARAFPARVSDPDPARVAAAAEFGARPVGGPEDLARLSVVVLCLPKPEVSRAVLREIAPRLPEGCVVVETSTVNPDDIAESARLLAPFGLRIVDASILAGVSQMEAGTATLLIGGDPAALADCQPVLDAIAEKQINFGALGSGAAAKVINNAVAHAVMVVVAEAGAMATAAEVDIENLIGLLSDPQMGLHRPLTHRYAERIVTGNYAGGMPLGAARKDSELALNLAQTHRVPLFAIQAAHSVYEMAVGAGYAANDYAVIARLFEGWGTPTVPPGSNKN